MKLLIKCCIALIIIAPILFISNRFYKNSVGLIPYPYTLKKVEMDEDMTNGPILIIGDKMATRVSTFKNDLATKISGKLAKPIVIKTIAQDGEGIHRTLAKLKSLNKLPLIIIYLGNLDEGYEQVFNHKDIEKINKNLEVYNNPNYRSLMMAFPELSRVFYNPIKKLALNKGITEDKMSAKNNQQLKIRSLQYKLYEAQVNELMRYTIKNNSFLIPITTPLKLLKKPKNSCYGSVEKSTINDLALLKQKLKNKDYKSAFNISRELVLINPYHSTSLFLHGFSAFKLADYTTAQTYLEQAQVYDCGIATGGPIYNSILRRTAQSNELQILDFHQFIVDQSTLNHTFLDDTYPQDYYIEKLADMLALKIKKLLRLN